MRSGVARSVKEKIRGLRESSGAAFDIANRIGWADVIVGIPFCNESGTLPAVVECAHEALRTYSSGKRCAVLAVGSPAGEEALIALKQAFPQDANDGIYNLFFLLGDGYDGKGWAELAMMKIARELGADAVMLEADLIGSADEDGAINVAASDCVHLLLEPMQKHGMDLVLSRFSPDWSRAAIARHFVSPCLGAIYGWRLPEDMGGEMAVSNRLLNLVLRDMEGWSEYAGGHGVDAWLTAAGIVNNARICEVQLGQRCSKALPAKRQFVFRQVVMAAFNVMTQHSRWWEARHGVLEAPALYVGGFGLPQDFPVSEAIPADQARGELIEAFKSGFSAYAETVFKGTLPDDAFAELEAIAKAPPEAFVFSPRLWARCVYHLLVEYAYRSGFSPEDLAAAICALLDGRLASASHESDLQAFLETKPEFLAKWRKEEEVRRPFLPKVAYWEFFPGVSLALPQEVESESGTVVSVTAAYENLVRQYKLDSETFVAKLAGADYSEGRIGGSEYTAKQIERFVADLEGRLTGLLPGALDSAEGLDLNIRAILKAFSRTRAFVPRPDVVAMILRRCPPVNLMEMMDCATVGSLLAKMSPRNALALVGWTEDRGYVTGLRSCIGNLLGPSDFEETDLGFEVIKREEFPLLGFRDVCALSRIAGRIVVTTLGKNLGGLFPRLRYLVTVAKSIVEAERFYGAWKEYSKDRSGFIDKVVNSLEVRRGTGVLSAHGFFENGHHRILAKRLKEVADSLRGSDAKEHEALAEALDLAAESYHLALMFPDGVFVPCSIWTWSGFSFNGGKGVPGSLSLHVERDWFVAELVTRVYECSGGDGEDMQRIAVNLIAQGREAEDITSHVFRKQGRLTPPVPPLEWDRVLPPAGEAPPAGKLRRYEGNPILFPNRHHWWESKYVLNPAAFRLGGKVYMIYRAFGEDAISRLGLAVLDDGFTVTERLPAPIFEPATEEEKRGCEDPRITVIDDTVYMLYTAYDGVVPQIAMAAITSADFLAGRWDKWERIGLAFPGLPNKDAILYPVRFDEGYAMCHRIAPSMWLSYSDSLKCPWPKEGYRVIMEPRSGLMWDAMKIGAGSQPLKTRFGWLSVYHGVDYALIYRLGVILSPEKDPARLLYRSPNPILEPEELYERAGDPALGLKSWVPNVVFTCGAIPAEDKEILDDNDLILVYYGAGDSSICVASATVAEILPDSVRARACSRR